MTEKHTPGPWEVQAPYGLNKVEITGKAGYAHIAAVMVKRSAGKDQWEPIPHGEGNARLIAAAPELLQACEAIAALADGQGRLNMLQVAGQARQAIAKATGKSNA